ncbi:MAG TPA: radical SAM family heme chaperone HemW [Chloroflexota bacterium]
MIRGDSDFGIYVHVPFCRMLCTYCDFVKYRGMEDWYTRYAAALLREGRTWQDQMRGRRGVSLFFGGGTPSVLGITALRTLRDQLAAVFELDVGAEYCLETNPEDVDATFAAGLSEAGFSRVSVGLQAFDDALLRRLGRLHTGSQGQTAVRLLIGAGINSISGDLIFGLPGQSLAAWCDTLERAIDLGLHHLSCYALTVEPATPLGRQVGRRRLTLPNDDAAADMYDHAIERLASAGYRHYEVSNWSRPGHFSRHNSLYWHGNDYVGLGAGAVGYRTPRRWWNQRRVEGYCAAVEAGGSAVAEEELLTLIQRAEELLLLGLRTDTGLPLDQFHRAIGIPLAQLAGAALEEALADALVILDGNCLRVPEQRWGVLHSVVARLLAGMDVSLVAAAAPPAPQVSFGPTLAAPTTSS